MAGLFDDTQGTEEVEESGVKSLFNDTQKSNEPEAPAEDAPDFIPGVQRGLQNLQSTLYGATALVGSGLKKLDAEDVGQSLQDFGMEGYRRNVEEAKQFPKKHSFKDIYTGETGVGGAIDWAQGTLGELVPSMVEAATGAVVGSAVAPGPGTVVGAFAGRTVLKKGIEKTIQQAMKKGIGDITEAQLRKRVTTQALKKFSSKAGMGAAVMPMESGGMYADLLESKGIDAPETALLFGALATSLEFAGGNSKLVDTFVDALSTGATGMVKKSAKEILTNIPQEALQEGGQELFSILNTVANTDEKLLTVEHVEQIIESMAAGAVGGGAGAVIQAGTNTGQEANTNQANQDPKKTELPTNTKIIIDGKRDFAKEQELAQQAVDRKAIIDEELSGRNEEIEKDKRALDEGRLSIDEFIQKYDLSTTFSDLINQLNTVSENPLDVEQRVAQQIDPSLQKYREDSAAQLEQDRLDNATTRMDDEFDQSTQDDLFQEMFDTQVSVEDQAAVRGRLQQFKGLQKEANKAGFESRRQSTTEETLNTFEESQPSVQEQQDLDELTVQEREQAIQTALSEIAQETDPEVRQKKYADLWLRYNIRNAQAAAETFQEEDITAKTGAPYKNRAYLEGIISELEDPESYEIIESAEGFTGVKKDLRPDQDLGEAPDSSFKDEPQVADVNQVDNASPVMPMAELEEQLNAIDQQISAVSEEINATTDPNELAALQQESALLYDQKVFFQEQWSKQYQTDEQSQGTLPDAGAENTGFDPQFQVSENLQNQETLAWNPERISWELSSAAYPDGRTKAVVAWINPADFIKSTTPNKKSGDTIRNESTDLDLEKLSDEFQTPFLYIKDGRIVGHEGRHRMAALADAGYTSVPIVLDYRRAETRTKESLDMLSGQQFETYSDNGQGYETSFGEALYVKNIIPLTFGNKKEIQAVMDQSATQFQTTENQEGLSQVNLADIKKTFPNQTVSQNEDGSVSIQFKNGKGLTINSMQNAGQGFIKLAIETGQMSKNGKILGITVGNEILLDENFADNKTLWHENKHVLDNLGLITESDNSALNKEFNKLRKQNKLEFALSTHEDATQRMVENRANMLAQIMVNRESYRNTPFGKTIQKIMDFFQQILAMGQQTVSGLASEFESGKIYERQVDGQTVQTTVPQAETTAKQWYSTLENAVTGFNQKQATPDQWKGMIKNVPGVKQDELDWTGVNEWLADQEGKVTQKDLLAFVQENNVQLEEVVNKSIETVTNEMDKILQPYGYSAEVEYDDLIILDKNGEMPDNLPKEIDDLIAPLRDTYNEAKYTDYQLPGGKNYKEILLTLPEKQTSLNQDAQAMFGKDFADLSADETLTLQSDQNVKAEGYKSGHFDESNILAHIRFNERTDVDGKKVLFLEEVQSDWHQAGRKEGYQGDLKIVKLGENNWATLDADGKIVQDGYQSKKAIEDEQAQYSQAVPNAPFKKAWPMLAMKRMVRYAAENGFDKIAWTTGEQQADRYNLSNQVDEIQYEHLYNGDIGWYYYISGNIDGESVFEKNRLQEKDLEQYLGKEITQKIIDGEDAGTLKGTDLKVGGEGMKAFYDKMLPSMLNKEFNRGKWGKSKIEVSQIGKTKESYTILQDGEAILGFGNQQIARENLEELIKKNPDTNFTLGMHPGDTFDSLSLPITDRMKAKALREGMPMFQFANMPISQQVLAGLINKKTETGTKEFKSWFGNSVTKNKKGDPVIFYHGTDEVFEEFTKDNAPKSGHLTAGLGHFFTMDKGLAEKYGQHQIKAYLKMENPYRMSLKESLSFETFGESEQFKADLEKQGYDSIIIATGASPYIIVFESGQAKSIHNQGDWNDKENIYFEVREQSDSKITNIPAFKKWFKGSKVVDASGDPLKVFHGSQYNFDSFQEQGRGLFSFSTSTELASGFATSKGQVYPVYLNAKNPFDFRNQEHINKFVQALKENPTHNGFYKSYTPVEKDFDYMSERIKSGDWNIIENVPILKMLGFDGAWTQNDFDRQNIQIHVFNNTQVKSIFNNEWDANNPQFQVAEQRIPQAEYDSVNAHKNNLVKSFAQQARIKATEVKLLADKAFGSISTRLKNVDPELSQHLRWLDFNTSQKIIDVLKTAKPLLDATKRMSPEDKSAWNWARLNSDEGKIEQIAQKYNLTADQEALREKLNNIRKEAKKVGYDVGYIEEYWPRVIKDQEGFLQATQEISQRPVFTEAIRAQAKKLGISQEQFEQDFPEVKADIISNLILGQASGIGGPGNIQSRVFESIPEEYAPFYMDADAALMQYVYSMTKKIEARKFFGKVPKRISDLKSASKRKNADLLKHEQLADMARAENPEMVAEHDDKINTLNEDLATIDEKLNAYKLTNDYTENIGSYIDRMRVDGKIQPKDEKTVRDILDARFHEHGTTGIVNAYKNLSYIDTMGSPLSAITQIGDLAWAMYVGKAWTPKGFTDTAKNLTNAVFNKSNITKEDLGIERIAQEFADGTTLSRGVSKVFKAVGLEKIDTIGKEVLINNALDQFKAQAAKDPEALARQIRPTFGNKSAEVVQEILAGNPSDNVKMLLYSRLLDFQPVALSEMPEYYLNSGNGRVFYMLKTYTLKQMDVFRKEVVHNLKSENPQQKIQGMKNMVQLMALLTIANATADEIKDFMLGKETKFSDNVIENFLTIGGASRYTKMQVSKDGLGSALSQQILPPMKFINSISKDAQESYKNYVSGDTSNFDNKRIIDSIPGLGKLYYWHYGRGSENKKSLAEQDFKKAGKDARLFKKQLENSDDKRIFIESNLDRFKQMKVHGNFQSALNRNKAVINKLEKIPSTENVQTRLGQLKQQREQILQRYLDISGNLS